MTSMPASRSARATTLAPRSWPSSPGLATRTRIGGALDGLSAVVISRGCARQNLGGCGLGQRSGMTRDGRHCALGRERHMPSVPLTGAALVQLDQHTSRTPGMDERQLLAVHPTPGRLVEHRVAEPAQPLDLGLHVVHLEADVVHALPAFLEV